MREVRAQRRCARARRPVTQPSHKHDDRREVHPTPEEPHRRRCRPQAATFLPAAEAQTPPVVLRQRPGKHLASRFTGEVGHVERAPAMNASPPLRLPRQLDVDPQ
jgi:hypothetical protein